MSFRGYKPYVSVAARRKKAEQAIARARKQNPGLAPIVPSRGSAIARTFWGRAWCANLERYSDYSNRLPRGRSYVRNGAVIGLTITPGEVHAQVMGSRLYSVTVTVAAVHTAQWQSIGADCAGSIDSLVELLQGKLSGAVMERICTPGAGLFPAPAEIRFSCSCPDWASMCKHVAAVLYGVGARLDQQPDLLFTLRRVDAQDLIARASAELPRAQRAPRPGKRMDDAALADVFGIEMAEVAAPPAAKQAVSAREGVQATRTRALETRDTAKAAGQRVASNGGLRDAAKPTKPTRTTKATKVTKAAKPSMGSRGARVKAPGKPGE